MPKLSKIYAGLLTVATLFLFFPLLSTEAANYKIADFEKGTLEGWDEQAVIISNPGNGSNYALRISNPANGSAGTRKNYNSALLQGYTNFEFDLNLHGTTILPGDASALVFEQGGWKWISLAGYVKNGFDGWQHVSVPLNQIPNLNVSAGIANINIRFWNYSTGNYDLDNLMLTGTQALTPPTNLSGSAAGTSVVSLTWQGSSLSYNIYLNGAKVGSSASTSYSLTNLSANTSYQIYVTSAAGSNESAPSNTISIKTDSASLSKKVIGDFESGTLDGWNENATLITNPGDGSNYAMRISNPVNGSAGAKKTFNSAAATGFDQIEFDVNIHGAKLLPGDASYLAFEQGGWHYVPLTDYLTNSLQGWQHITIPFSSLGVNSNSGIAYANFRFWNYIEGTYDIDNIVFSSKSGTVEDPTLPTAPTGLSGSATGPNSIALNWNGTALHYRIYRDGNAIATTDVKNYTDTAVYPSVNYRYQVSAYNQSLESARTAEVVVQAGKTVNSWTVKSVDSQVASKYWTLDANQIAHLVDADKALGAKYIAISTSYDNYSKLKSWADIIHSRGLNVWFRCHWNDWDSWEKEEIKNGISSDEYLNRTKQFIISHPELFRAGDSFAMAVESENAAWWTGIDSGPFHGWEDYRSFLRNEVIYSNDAFSQIGLGGKVHTNWINMNGWVAWNVLDQQTVNTLGMLTLDHIIDWTEDINTYKTALFSGYSSNGNRLYGYDEYYAKWHVPIMAGEWGYSTYNQNLTPEAQQNMIATILNEFAKRDYFKGLNYWVDVGHAGRLFDSANLLDYKIRPSGTVLKNFYL